MRGHERKQRFGLAQWACRSLAVFLCLSLGSGPARAESRLFPSVLPGLSGSSAGPKVVVLAVALDKEAEKKAGLLEGVGERAVDQAGRFELLPLSVALDPAAADARKAAARRAEAALKEGQKALDDLDAKGATKLFDEALEQARAGEPGTPAGFDTYVQALLMRAGAMVALGNNAQAKAEIEKIVSLSPRAAFPDAYFPPT